VNSVLYRQSSSADRPRPKLNFEKNENVRIVDGRLQIFQARLDEVHPERNTLRVLVTIFGRATPVELDFLQVEKIKVMAKKKLPIREASEFPRESHAGAAGGTALGPKGINIMEFCKAFNAKTSAKDQEG